MPIDMSAYPKANTNFAPQSLGNTEGGEITQMLELIHERLNLLDSESAALELRLNKILMPPVPETTGAGVAPTSSIVGGALAEMAARIANQCSKLQDIRNRTTI